MGDISSRLARIEVGQEFQKEQLDKVIALLDRMVRVEEKLEGVLEDNRDQERRIKDADEKMDVRVSSVEQELDSWKPTIKILSWLTGLATVVLAALIVKSWV